MSSSWKEKRISPNLMTIAFGCVWGLIELSLGGFLHFIHLPLKGVVLGGIGVALMVVFVLLTGRPGLVLWLGVIAASGKFLDVLLFGLSPFSPAVVNPAAAIVLEALVFRMVVPAFLWRRCLPTIIQTSAMTKP